MLTGSEADVFVLDPVAGEVSDLDGVGPVGTRCWLRNGTIIDGVTGRAKPFDAALDDDTGITAAETATVVTASQHLRPGQRALR